MNDGITIDIIEGCRVYAIALLEVGEQIQALFQSLDRLDGLIRDSQIHKAVVYHLPRITQDQTHQPYSRLEVTPLSGSAAVSEALSAYRSWYAEGAASTKSVFRLPGAIALTPADPEAFDACLGEIQAIKLRISELTAGIYPDSPAMRHKVIHEEFPRLVMLQLTRAIKRCDEPLYSCRFTWVRKSSIKRLDKRSAAAEVGQLKAVLPNENSQVVPWKARVAQEQRNLLALPAQTGLRLRRPVKAHPMMNLIFEERILTPKGEKRRQKMVDANLPILILGSPKVKIGALKDFDPDKQVSTRGRTLTTDTPITPMKPIYPLR